MYGTRYSCHISMKLGLYTNFLKNKKKTQISNFMKTRSVEAEVFHSGGRMDKMRKLAVAIRNFAKTA